MRGPFRLCVPTVLFLSFGSAAQSPSSAAESPSGAMLTAALDGLDRHLNSEFSIRSRSARWERTTEADSKKWSSFRPWLDGSCAKPKFRHYCTWSRGRMAGFCIIADTCSEERIFGVYFDGSDSCVLNYGIGRAEVFPSEFRMGDGAVWPLAALGIRGATSIATELRNAIRNRAVSHSVDAGGRLVAEWPGGKAVFERPGYRLVSLHLGTWITVAVTSWKGPYPSALTITYTEPEKRSEIKQYMEVEVTPDIRVRPDTMMKHASGFHTLHANPSTFSTKRGYSRMLRREAEILGGAKSGASRGSGHLRRERAEWTAALQPENTEYLRELLGDARASGVSGLPWPGVMETFKRGVREGNRIKTPAGPAYCVQASLSVLSNLRGEAVSFEDLLGIDSRPQVSVEDAISLSKRHGIPLVPVKLEPASMGSLRGAFLVCEEPKSEGGIGHLSVAVPTGSGKVLRWRGPGERSTLLVRPESDKAQLCLLPEEVLLSYERAGVPGGYLLWCLVMALAGGLGFAWYRYSRS